MGRSFGPQDMTQLEPFNESEEALNPVIRTLSANHTTHAAELALRSDYLTVHFRRANYFSAKTNYFSITMNYTGIE